MIDDDMKARWDGATWSERNDMVASMMTAVDVAEMLGLDPDRNDKIRPPWNPNERTPSCQLYEDSWYDFATGRWGDLAQLVVEYARAEGDDEMDDPHALWLLYSKGLHVGHEPGDVERKPPRVREDLSHVIRNGTIVPSMFGFDVSRFGIVETDGDILVPHRDPEGVYGVKIRQAAGGKSSVPGSQFTTRLYDPYGWVPRPPTPVCVITEGESDCWAMDWALGPDIDVYGLPSGASCWKDHWLDDLEPYHTVWLCFDNDRAGKQALDKVTRKVGWAKARELRVPDLYTDARAAIEAGWVPAL